MKGSNMKALMVCAIGAAVLAAGAATASAGVIWSDDFESLNTGPINGQSTWYQDMGTLTDVEVVSDATAYQGTKYLSIAYSDPTRAANSPRIGQTGLTGAPVNGADTYVLSMALRFTATGHNGLLTSLYGDAGAHRELYTYFNSAGEIYANSAFTDLNAAIAPNTWYNVTYVMDPATLHYQFTVRRASDNYVVLDQSVAYDSGAAVSSWYTLSFQQDSAAGNAFQLDNMSFSEVPVPEPMTGSLLLIGGGLLALRRRQR